MDGGDDGIQVLPLCAHHCIYLQLSLNYINQPKVLFATTLLCEEETKSMKEMWKRLIS
jgi:hypothetical protein